MPLFLEPHAHEVHEGPGWSLSWSVPAPKQRQKKPL